MTNTVSAPTKAKRTRKPKVQPFPAISFDPDLPIAGEAQPLTDGEFEALMQLHDELVLEGAIEAADQVLEDAGGEIETVEAHEEQAPDMRSFAERVAGISDEQRDVFLWDTADRLDDRLARADSASVRNLTRARKAMVQPHVARCLAAAEIGDCSFVNREWMEGKQFNVYALLKLADVAKGLVGGVIGNAVNIAVIKSMFALQAAGIPFDFDTAKAAASTKHTPQRPGVRQHLTRHTVAAGTASTQAGSTMHALMALGVVRFAPSKNPTYTILENATTEALRSARFEMDEAA